MSDREKFIKELFIYLEPKAYAVLKSIGKNLQDLPEGSDIDIVIPIKEAEEFIRSLVNYPILRHYSFSKKPHMFCIELFFKDGSFLSLDLLFRFFRKNIDYLNGAELIENAFIKDGVKILKVEYDYWYTWLFYQLNLSAVPAKYSNALLSWYTKEEQEKIIQFLNKKIGTNYSTLAESFNKTSDGILKKYIYQQVGGQNTILKLFLRGGGYCFSLLKDFVFSKGMIISFTGVDGAGKTTILSNIKNLLENKYRRKVVVLRHRPSILPILSAWKYGKQEAEKRSVASLPRTGKNSNKLSSFLRFGYYYLDYFLGQWFIFVKHSSKGTVVLYDRYYFDFIVDSKRSNLVFSESLSKPLYFFVHKPDLSIFLYAKPEVILKRKLELSASDIKELTGSYLDLFASFKNPSKYLCIENELIEATLSKIENSYLQCLENRGK